MEGEKPSLSFGCCHGEGDDTAQAAPGSRGGGGRGRVHWVEVGSAREKRERRIVCWLRIRHDTLRKIRNSLFSNLFITFKLI
jgi:hypothetical protein